jgi:hypothetical protein
MIRSAAHRSRSRSGSESSSNSTSVESKTTSRFVDTNGAFCGSFTVSGPAAEEGGSSRDTSCVRSVLADSLAFPSSSTLTYETPRVAPWSGASVLNDLPSFNPKSSFASCTWPDVALFLKVSTYTKTVVLFIDGLSNVEPHT